MRFPSVTSFRPTRPPMGADTRVNSTSSRAASTAACASSTDASACRTFDSRMSDSSCEMAWLLSRSAARAKFLRASASRDFASSTSASVRCSAASYGRGSIRKRRSPLWTIAPSWKWIDCRYPLTRGRTSTESMASRRAVYSSHSVISRATGWTTFTFGGGGAGAGREPHAERTSAAATSAHVAHRVGSSGGLPPGMLHEGALLVLAEGSAQLRLRVHRKARTLDGRLALPDLLDPPRHLLLVVEHAVR